MLVNYYGFIRFRKWGILMVTRKKLEKTLKGVKDILQGSIRVGDDKYIFATDIFDLDRRNLAELNEQIIRIPGNVAYVVEAHGRAEDYLARTQALFDFWFARMANQFCSDSKEFRSESGKHTFLQGHATTTKKYIEYKDEILAAKKVASTLKAYREGMTAKLQLAQTLSANIRTERDSYARDYDKK